MVADFTDAEDVVTECMRDIARWLYRQLNREWDHMTSDACADDAIAADGYTFTEFWPALRLTTRERCRQAAAKQVSELLLSRAENLRLQARWRFTWPHNCMAGTPSCSISPRAKASAGAIAN